MKKLVKITSVLCGILAVFALIFGIRALTGGGRIINLAIFSMIARGTIMTFFGNLMSIVITCGGFGMMCYSGFQSFRDSKANKTALIWGAVMTVICLISVVCSIAGGNFNFGDLILLGIPMVYTFSIIQAA